VFFYAVEGDKGQQDGHRFDVLLVFGVRAVILVLSDFKPSCAAEHYEYYARIAHKRHNPLTHTEHAADARQHNTRPEYHLTQIVGAANQFVQTGVDEAAGVLLFGAVFLHGGKMTAKSNGGSAEFGFSL